MVPGTKECDTCIPEDQKEREHSRYDRWRIQLRTNELAFQLRLSGFSSLFILESKRLISTPPCDCYQLDCSQLLFLPYPTHPTVGFVTGNGCAVCFQLLFALVAVGRPTRDRGGIQDCGLPLESVVWPIRDTAPGLGWHVSLPNPNCT